MDSRLEQNIPYDNEHKFCTKGQNPGGKTRCIKILECPFFSFQEQKLLSWLLQYIVNLA